MLVGCTEKTAVLGQMFPAIMLVWIIVMPAVVRFPKHLTIRQNVILFSVLTMFSRSLLISGLMMNSADQPVNGLFFVVDLFVTGSLLLFLNHRRLETRWVMVYLFHPLVLLSLSSKFGTGFTNIFFLLSIFFVVPLVVLRPGLSWAMTLLTLPLSFLLLSIALDGSHDPGVLPLFILIIPYIIIIIIEIAYLYKRRGVKKGRTTCKTVSVVIPTLNEADAIEKCLWHVFQNKDVSQVIVMDAGSTDKTKRIAENAGAEVFVEKKPIDMGGGRGGQIKAGIMKATGDVLAIVHADACVSKKIFSRVIEVLNHNPAIIGGAVGCGFDSDDQRLRYIEFANDFRMGLLGLSFGDQVQFFRRQPIVDHNIFPDFPLMEDVEFCVRLHRLGRQVYLFGETLVSARRWQYIGFKNTTDIIKIVITYLIKRILKTPDTVKIYKNYYNRNY